MTISRRTMLWRSAMAALGVVAAKLGFKEPSTVTMTYAGPEQHIVITYMDYEEPPTLVDLYVADDDGIYHKVNGITNTEWNQRGACD